jgi:hypothetical protein
MGPQLTPKPGTRIEKSEADLVSGSWQSQEITCLASDSIISFAIKEEKLPVQSKQILQAK